MRVTKDELIAVGVGVLVGVGVGTIISGKSTSNNQTGPNKINPMGKGKRGKGKKWVVVHPSDAPVSPPADAPVSPPADPPVSPPADPSSGGSSTDPSEEKTYNLGNGDDIASNDTDDKISESDMQGATILSVTTDPDTEDAVYVKYPDNWSSKGYDIGTYLVASYIGDDQKVVKKRVIPIPISGDNAQFKIVLSKDDQTFTKHILSGVTSRAFKISTPHPFFNYNTTKKAKVVLIASGNGIKPCVQVMHKILESEGNNVPVQLIYKVSDKQNMLKTDIDDLALKFKDTMVKGSQKPICTVAYCASDDELNTAVTDIASDTKYGALQRYCICGPGTFNDDMKLLIQTKSKDSAQYEKLKITPWEKRV